MVIIHNDRGYNIGFVLREALDHEIPLQANGVGGRGHKIRYVTTLSDNGSKIRSILESKIEAEKYASYQCLLHIRGHRLSQLAEILTTEFQFDRKKLTVYLKKHEDVSVCRLVRKLYETFKMRIKVIEVDCFEEFQQTLLTYLETSRLEVSFEELLATSPTLTDKGEVFLQFKNSQNSLKETKPSPPTAQPHNLASSRMGPPAAPPSNHHRQLGSRHTPHPYPVFTLPHPVTQYQMSAYPQYSHHAAPALPTANYVHRVPQYPSQYYDPRAHMILMNHHTPLVHLPPPLSEHLSHVSRNNSFPFPRTQHPPQHPLPGGRGSNHEYY
jgi:hypothetical protein